MAKNNDNNFELSSYWSRFCNDVTTGLRFDVLCDYKIKDLVNMVQRPMEFNEMLRHISRRLYSAQGLVRNTIDYISSLPTLDYVITTRTKDSKSRINKEIVDYTLDVIKHKEIVRDFILKCCIDGTAYYYFETAKRNPTKEKSLDEFTAYSITEINALKKSLTDINASVINLPTDYCRIVGIKNNNYVVAFDLKYFDEGNEPVEHKLRKFPKEIIDGYNNYKNGKGKEMLILDETKTLCYKISANRDEPYGRPLVLAAIEDILFKNHFKNTKRNILNNVNNQIIYETFPEGKTAGTSALTKQQQEYQHNVVKKAVQNKNNVGGTSFFSVAAGTKIDSIKIDTDLFDDDGYETNLDINIGTDLGFAASLLSASGTTSFSSQQTNLELVTSQIFQWIEAITNELNKVINYNILNKQYIEVKINYLPITHLNRKQHFAFAKELFTIGRGSLSYMAVCAGIPEEVFFAMLDEQLEKGIMEKYPVNATSYNTSGNAESGRPSIDDATNENTVKSKTNNSNNQPKPSD